MIEKNRKMKQHWGYACVGSHRGIYVTATSPHQECIDRFQIYDSWASARKWAYSDDEVVRVKITKATQQHDRYE